MTGTTDWQTQSDCLNIDLLAGLNEVIPIIGRQSDELHRALYS